MNLPSLFLFELHPMLRQIFFRQLLANLYINFATWLEKIAVSKLVAYLADIVDKRRIDKGDGKFSFYLFSRLQPTYSLRLGNFASF